jgi:hypothetical protein
MYSSGRPCSSLTMLHAGRRRGSGSAALSLDQARGAHVGPVLLDVLEATGTGVRVVRDGPAMRRGLSCRPQAVLTFVVHKHSIGSVWIFKGIRHGDPHSDGRCQRRVTFRGSPQRRPPRDPGSRPPWMSLPPGSLAGLAAARTFDVAREPPHAPVTLGTSGRAIRKVR